MSVPSAASPDATALSRKFVRVLDPARDGFVCFEFSIGWPELAVELLMPEPAFHEFCATHRVRRLDGGGALRPQTDPGDDTP